MREMDLIIANDIAQRQCRLPSLSDDSSTAAAGVSVSLQHITFPQRAARCATPHSTAAMHAALRPVVVAAPCPTTTTTSRQQAVVPSSRQQRPGGRGSASTTTTAAAALPASSWDSFKRLMFLPGNGGVFMTDADAEAPVYGDSFIMHNSSSMSSGAALVRRGRRGGSSTGACCCPHVAGGGLHELGIGRNTRHR
jgi:hypothetical protein